MTELIFSLLKDFEPGRFLESLAFLFVLWMKVKPHLKKIEDRMLGLENGLKTFNATVTDSFKSGENRFIIIESRLDKLEGPKDPISH